VKAKKITQIQFIKEWFIAHSNKDVTHEESKKAIERAYEKQTGKRLEDCDRGIRSLAQRGFLIKIEKGVYRYDPSQVSVKTFREFSSADKKFILKRDGFKCSYCGLGKKEGLELHVDHIRPRELGGKSQVENGQILCGRHNYIKKIASQTETGKKMFINLLELAKKTDDSNRVEIIEFCEDILSVFEKHGINGHIEWKR